MHNKSLNRILRVLFRCVFIALIVFELLAWTEVISVTLEFTWLGLIATSSAVWIFLEIMSTVFTKRGKEPLHGLAYMFACIAVTFDMLGDVQRWYGEFVWYDQMMHFVGGAAAAFVFWSILKNSINQHTQQSQPWILYWLTIGLSALAGISYEAEEYLEDVFTGSNRLGDGPDTANDLLLNVCGHILAVVLLWIVSRLATKRHVS